MAENTIVNAAMQARDWELIFGLVFNTGDIDMLEVQFALSVLYRNPATRPATPSDVVVITTNERTVLRIAEFLNGSTVRYVTKDIGPSQFARIMAALRAMNNVADNYINTQLALKDAEYNALNTSLRKNGRKYIMIAQADNQ